MLNCPVKFALDLLNGKWTLQIIWELSQRSCIRFNELKRKLPGISNLMLSKTLQSMQSSRLVTRKQYNEIPPRVEYSLTDLGRELYPALMLIGKWGYTAYRKIYKEEKLEA